MKSDVPLLTEFDPNQVPYQMDVINDVRCNLDYSLGVHQILLSGSVGSAKSLLVSHIIITHCLTFPKAHAGIGRLTMPDLKGTLLQMILDHLGESGEIVNYDYNKTTGQITFLDNGSKITCHSWHDQNYKRFRSYNFSCFAIEELTENDTKDARDAILMRIGRNTRIPEKFLIMPTNPDDPEHWAYKEIIEKQGSKIHVYYSKTKDNKFLDPSYYDTLNETLDEKMALRMLEGLWVSIEQEVIYYNYNKDRNYVDDDYEIDTNYPILISWDFNIGIGKPLSACLAQFVDGVFHFFAEVVVHGARTENSLDEMAGKDYFETEQATFKIHGDATGKARSTNSNRSNYDIIDQYLANYQTKKGAHLDYELAQPRSNPPIKTRHNLMNGLMFNLKQQVRLKVYRACKTLHEGLTLTKLKAGGQYSEDDSKPYQHITTAAGYLVCAELAQQSSRKQGSVQL